MQLRSGGNFRLPLRPSSEMAPDLPWPFHRAEGFHFVVVFFIGLILVLLPNNWNLDSY